jgi:hypothetical protein
LCGSGRGEFFWASPAHARNSEYIWSERDLKVVLSVLNLCPDKFSREKKVFFVILTTYFFVNLVFIIMINIK